MADERPPFLTDELSKRTVIFGLHIWVIIGIGVGAAFVFLLFFLSLWLASRRSSAAAAPTHRRLKEAHRSASASASSPSVSKEIQEIRVDPKPAPPPPHRDSDNPTAPLERQSPLLPAEAAQQRIHIELGKDHRITYPERHLGGGAGGSSHCSGESRSSEQVAMPTPEVSHLGWGHWYTLKELQSATDMFADENVIGEGGYGIVYHGILEDQTQVAVKNLLNNRYRSLAP